MAKKLCAERLLEKCWWRGVWKMSLERATLDKAMWQTSVLKTGFATFVRKAWSKHLCLKSCDKLDENMFQQLGLQRSFGKEVWRTAVEENMCFKTACLKQWNTKLLHQKLGTFVWTWSFSANWPCQGKCWCDELHNCAKKLVIQVYCGNRFVELCGNYAQRIGRWALLYDTRPFKLERWSVGERLKLKHCWPCCQHAMVETWLILPVVICLSQRLSHACLSINCFILWNCEWLIKSVIVYLMVPTTRITVVILELIRA